MFPQSGFRVTRLFHPTAMVGDLTEIGAFYHRIFRADSLSIPYSDQGRAYRSLTVVADTCIENISPEQTHLSQFRMYHDIVGNHWFFPCFYVADMQDALYQLHHRHRIRLTASGTGNAVVGMPPGSAQRTLLYTHPADTGIMWEFWEGDEEWFRTNPLADPRMRPGWQQSVPAADDPIAALRLSHHVIVLRDFDRAAHFLVEICGGRVFAEEEDVAQGGQSLWIEVGDEPAIFELIRPTREGPCRRDLERVGNTAHSLTFQVRDLPRAAAHLKENGISLEIDTADLVVTDAATSHGLRFGFVKHLHPRDPRASGADRT
jgi:hypothetical protein